MTFTTRKRASLNFWFPTIQSREFYVDQSTHDLALKSHDSDRLHSDDIPVYGRGPSNLLFSQPKTALKSSNGKLIASKTTWFDNKMSVFRFSLLLFLVATFSTVKAAPRGTALRQRSLKGSKKARKHGPKSRDCKMSEFCDDVSATCTVPAPCAAY